MNKKGELAFMIKIAIGLTIGIVLILFSMTFWKVIVGLLFPEMSVLTENTMEELSEAIIRLEGGDNTTVLFYMSGDFVLVAFDKSKSFGSGSLGYYERPVSCFDSSCLVVCRDSDSGSACKNSDLLYLFEFDNFDLENPDTGIISVVKGKYVEFYVEKKSNSVTIRETNEN
jgi:hypothetical protein